MRLEGLRAVFENFAVWDQSTIDWVWNFLAFLLPFLAMKKGRACTAWVQKLENQPNERVKRCCAYEIINRVQVNK